VTVYDIATQLPSIDVLRQRCKALAMLDAIIGGDRYTYNRARGADEAASMRNGSGDEYDIVFCADGAFIRGFYHDSPMFEYADGLWPGLLDGLPEVFQTLASEPSFRSNPDGVLDATFVLWRSSDDEQWHAGNNIDFSPADDDEVDPDGSWLLNIVLDDIALTYREFAEEVYEVVLPLSAIRHVTEFLPLTDEVIHALNRDALSPDVGADAVKFAYPLASGAESGDGNR
jgi:hypothetical protein